MQIHGVDVGFQIVDDNFPITEMGILGMPFLEKLEAKLIFRNSISNSLQFDNMDVPLRTWFSYNLPPRAKTFISIPVKHTENETGYIRKLDTEPGV